MPTSVSDPYYASLDSPSEHDSAWRMSNIYTVSHYMLISVSSTIFTKKAGENGDGKEEKRLTAPQGSVRGVSCRYVIPAEPPHTVPYALFSARSHYQRP